MLFSFFLSLRITMNRPSDDTHSSTYKILPNVPSGSRRSCRVPRRPPPCSAMAPDAPRAALRSRGASAAAVGPTRRPRRLLVVVAAVVATAAVDCCPLGRGGPPKGTQIRARAARCITAEPAERASHRSAPRKSSTPSGSGCEVGKARGWRVGLEAVGRHRALDGVE